MPQNGEVNTSFGVYRNVCCGQEVTIRKGATFPDCSRHPKLTTIWKPLDEASVDDVSEIIKKSNAEPAA
jgi:hypothetical protein